MNRIDNSTAKWQEYERRKAELMRKSGMLIDQKEYEKAIAKILRELKL